MIPANFHMFHFKFVGTRALVWIHPHLMTVPPACRKTMPLPCRVFMKSPEFPICQDESDLIRPKTLPSCLLLCGWAETAVFLTKSTRDRNHLNRSCGIHLAAKQPCPPQKHVPMERTRLISTDQSEPKAAKKAPRLKTIPSYLSIGTSKRIHLYVYIFITSTVVCSLGKSIDITIISGFLFLLLPCQHLLYRYTNWWFSRPWPCHCTICCAYSLDSEYMSKKVPNYSSDDNIPKVYHMSHHCKTGAIYEPCRYL
jgi:hypothetical protein